VAGFLKELRRRNVFRVGIAYLVAAWLVIQLVNNLVPFMNVPEWVGGAVLILLIAGFVVAVIVAWAFELTAEGVKLTASAAPADLASRPPVSRKWDFAIIVALVVALGFALLDGSPTTDQPVVSSTETIVAPSIAVLPFLNLSSDQEQEYFSDGLADELLNKLAKIEGLRVASRTSSFTFKGSNDDAQTIARKLNVANVLEGSVRRSGDTFRILVQLIEAEGGTHLWSESFDRELDDILEVQDEIAETVAARLRITLGVAERAKLKTSTDSVEAYDHYLAGISLLNEFGSNATERGIAEVQRATEIDPDYADAWAVLSVAYLQNAYLVTREFEIARARAEDAARHALTINDELAPAHTALGHVYTIDGDWARAEQEFLTALAIPSDFSVAWDYAEFLEVAGYQREALEYRRAARQEMPLNVAPAVDLASVHHRLDDDERAAEELERAESLVGDPGSLVALRLKMAMNRRDAPFLRSALVTSLANQPGDAELAALIEIFDAPETARDRLLGLQASTRDPVRVAGWAAYFGEPDIAAELVRSIALQGPLTAQLYWEPFMRDSRKTDVFKQTMRDMGLVDFWRARGWPPSCRPTQGEDFACD
jgi:TolB-like protein/Tfp pilus assembly protein PilF